jgi:hypothetical protein
MVLAVLEDGHFSATYKYAVFLALTDICIESGIQPDQTVSFTTRQLAEHVVRIYWSHTREFANKGVLQQAHTGNHRIVTWISRYQMRAGVDSTRDPSSMRDSGAFQRLLDKVERKLIEDPIPRLQVLQNRPFPFLFECPWTLPLDRRVVTRMVREGRTTPNQIHLLPGVPEALVRLNGIMRPLVQREWARRVAGINGFEEDDLLAFLFESPRIATSAVREGLRDIQRDACFFCERPLRGPVHVDHFVPRRRYADDSIDNLVLADQSCNSSKKILLPSERHVAKWVRRARDPALAKIAENSQWPRDSSRTLSVASSLYRRLPEGSQLWVSADATITVDIERSRILTLLDASR